MSQRPGAIGGHRSLTDAPYEDLQDPANGEKVPRCAVCGIAGQSGRVILRGVWAYANFKMPLVLCDACFRWLAPDNRPDPLHVDEAA